MFVYSVCFSEIGAPDVWDKIIYPGMKESVIGTLLSTLEISESRKVTFYTGFEKKSIHIKYVPLLTYSFWQFILHFFCEKI